MAAGGVAQGGHRAEPGGLVRPVQRAGADVPDERERAQPVQRGAAGRGGHVRPEQAQDRLRGHRVLVGARDEQGVHDGEVQRVELLEGPPDRRADPGAGGDDAGVGGRGQGQVRAGAQQGTQGRVVLGAEVVEQGPGSGGHRGPA